MPEQPRLSSLPRLLKAQEVADYLGLGLSTVYRLGATGALPCFYVGQEGTRGNWRVTEDQLAAFVQERIRQNDLETGRAVSFERQQDR